MYQNINSLEKVYWVLLIHGTTDQLSVSERWRQWRYNVEQYQNLRNLMVYAIRSNHDQDLKNMIEKIFGTMGFSGSREQAKALVTLMKEEWKLRRGSQKMPELPKLISWVRRKADKGIWLIRGTLPPPKAKD